MVSPSLLVSWRRDTIAPSEQASGTHRPTPKVKSDVDPACGLAVDVDEPTEQPWRVRRPRGIVRAAGKLGPDLAVGERSGDHLRRRAL